MSTAKRRVWRVFVGPVEISGIADSLVKGFRELEVDAEIILSLPHRFKYGKEPESWIVKVWQKISAVRLATPRRHLFRKLLMVSAHGLWGWLVLISVIARFNAFIFLFGQSITGSTFELWLLRRLRKKIIFVCVGSDTRPPYIDGSRFAGMGTDSLPHPETVALLSLQTKKRLKRMENYADYIINSPTTAHFHERPFISWNAIGIPKEVGDASCAKHRDGAAVRIIHSPSNDMAKGTPAISSAIERLKEKGHKIEFIKIQNMPNKKVIEELKGCDFIVDQLYSDTPMAGFATEAACFGKPAVVGGYFSSIINAVENKNLAPSLFVEPEQIESAIEKLIVDVQYRFELGSHARLFVTKQWSLGVVAERYLKLLNDEPEPHWWCEPREITYLEGSGLSRDRVRHLVKALIEHKGVSALQLSDKPDLERAFCRLASDVVAEK